jgi:hypothetical protein
MTKFSDRDPFDPKEAGEPDRLVLGAAFAAAGMAIFVGVSLIATADIHDGAGLLRAGAGALLCVAAAVGFRMYWNRL